MLSIQRLSSELYGTCFVLLSGTLALCTEVSVITSFSEYNSVDRIHVSEFTYNLPCYFKIVMIVCIMTVFVYDLGLYKIVPVFENSMTCPQTL